MGRQAYLARLALGRSAFEAPVRDENGDFILGGLAREFDNSEYVQQWDDRGHPENQSSVSQARRFRKAQNEVLQACGVIVRRDVANKSEWEAKSFDQKLEVVTRENKRGWILSGFERDGGTLFSWWATSLRRRIMTFGFNAPSLTSTIASDFSTYGILRFLFAGLPGFFLNEILKVARYAARDPEANELVDYLDPHRRSRRKTWLEWVGESASQLGYLAFEVPIEILSILSSIYFLKADNIFNPWLFAHFLPGSPIFLPSAPTTWSLNFVAYYMIELFHTPLALSLLRDYLQLHIGYRTYALLRQITVKPDKPDRLSIQAASDEEFENATSVPGLGRRIGQYTDRRFYGSSTFRNALPLAFPIWRQGTPPLQTQSDVGRYVLQQCARIDIRIDQDSEETFRHYGEAIAENLESLGIDIEEEYYVNLDEWTTELRRQRFNSVTSLDPDESFLAADIDDQEALQTQNSIAAPALPVADSHAPTVPSNTPAPEGGVLILDEGNEQVTVFPNAQSQEGAEPFTTVLPLQNLLQPIGDPSIPPTPEPGIRRATSLTQTTPRPVRRPTEIDSGDAEETLNAFREDLLRPLRINRNSGRLSSVHKSESRQYRVSWMSALTADSFAWHSSAIITSICLLPVESLYLRTITRWFRTVSSNPGEFRAPLGADVWFGGDTSIEGRLKYTGALVLCLGLESIARGIIWRIAGAIAVSYSKTSGWGVGNWESSVTSE